MRFPARTLLRRRREDILRVRQRGRGRGATGGEREGGDGHRGGGGHVDVHGGVVGGAGAGEGRAGGFLEGVRGVGDRSEHGGFEGEGGEVCLGGEVVGGTCGDGGVRDFFGGGVCAARGSCGGKVWITGGEGAEVLFDFFLDAGGELGLEAFLQGGALETDEAVDLEARFHLPFAADGGFDFGAGVYLVLLELGDLELEFLEVFGRFGFFEFQQAAHFNDFALLAHEAHNGEVEQRGGVGPVVGVGFQTAFDDVLELGGVNGG